ncbi:MAG: hypothetical protein V4649_14985 [Bacteroidota bacterium]
MQQLTVHIPDNKIAFFIELTQSLGFQVDKPQAVLSGRQMEEVMEQHNKIKNEPTDFLDWDEARKTLKFD